MDSSVALFKETGVMVPGKIIEDGPVRLAFFGDPDRNPIYLTQVKRGVWVRYKFQCP